VAERRVSAGAPRRSPALFAWGAPRGDETDHGPGVTIRVNDDQQAQRTAEAEQDETILGRHGMIRVIQEQRVLVGEGGPGLVKGHPVLPLVRGRLPCIPDEP
jgi:hypothetical protein